MEDLLNVIGNVGFPIAVAAYLLIRIEGKLNDLTAAIGSLRGSHYYSALRAADVIPCYTASSGR